MKNITQKHRTERIAEKNKRYAKEEKKRKFSFLIFSIFVI